jgi:hypothetical protein
MCKSRPSQNASVRLSLNCGIIHVLDFYWFILKNRSEGFLALAIWQINTFYDEGYAGTPSIEKLFSFL